MVGTSAGTISQSSPCFVFVENNRWGLLLLMPAAAPAAAVFVSASYLLSRTVNPRLGTVPSCSPRSCQRRQFTTQTATAGSPPGPSCEMCKGGAATTRNPIALPQDRADRQPKTTSPRGTRGRFPRTRPTGSQKQPPHAEPEGAPPGRGRTLNPTP